MSLVGMLWGVSAAAAAQCLGSTSVVRDRDTERKGGCLTFPLVMETFV